MAQALAEEIVPRAVRAADAQQAAVVQSRAAQLLHIDAQRVMSAASSRELVGVESDGTGSRVFGVSECQHRGDFNADRADSRHVAGPTIRT